MANDIYLCECDSSSWMVHGRRIQCIRCARVYDITQEKELGDCEHGSHGCAAYYVMDAVDFNSTRARHEIATPAVVRDSKGDMIFERGDNWPEELRGWYYWDMEYNEIKGSFPDEETAQVENDKAKAKAGKEWR